MKVSTLWMMESYDLHSRFVVFDSDERSKMKSDGTARERGVKDAAPYG